MQTRLIGGATYFSRAQLEATNPSRREGIDAVAEARWRSTTSKLVKTAIKTLKLPDWVYETAMNYINRFFLTRSISKNDRHLVVGGAILLASKVQESPRPVQDVAYVLLQLKHANKQKPQHGPDQTTLEQFIEGVMLAEQAMLFSLNFNLNVETHVSLARRLFEPLDLWAKTNPAPEEAEANQLKLSLYAAVMFFLNDSALTNLSLQYPNSKVAPVTLVMAAKRLAATRYSGKEVPPALQRVLALATDAAWFESKGLSLGAAAEIEAQINELYATSPAQPAVQQQRQQQAQAHPVPHSATAAAAAGQPITAPPASEPPRPSQQPVGAGAGRMQTVSPPAAAEETKTGQLAEASAARAATPNLAAATVPTSSMQAPLLHAHNEVSSADPKGYDAAPQRPGSPASADAEAGATTTTPCCRQGQPSSSAAAEAAAAGTTAGGTPELPHPRSPGHKSQPLQQLRVGKRVSDGDECTGEQQATSELHAAPEQRPEAETEAATRDAGGTGPCLAFNGADDSANENCSPNGLTTGNASGSGCGVAEGQPEVCSRTEAPVQQLQSQPTQPQSVFDISGFESSQPPLSQSQQCGKRRTRDGEDGVADELTVVGVLAPAVKARRLEESQPVSVQHGP
ncbi:hypothetical protein PLESTM_000977900 [Pleodorina starrii]|nr:hypothetical protein PLESTM_000977900 [Pleodorina starrii]